MPIEKKDAELYLADQVRELTSQFDRAAHLYAEANDLYASDFRALLLLHAAEQAGRQLTAGELAQQLSLSSGAVTYLVERLVSAGQLVRDSDPTDRRKVLLVRSEKGREVTRGYNTPLNSLVRVALTEFDTDELTVATRVLARFQRAGELYQEELQQAAVAAGRARQASKRSQK